VILAGPNSFVTLAGFISLTKFFAKGKDRNPRKLTERECARLQGFPDSFKIPVSRVQAYKQFGNSVPVNVLEEISIQMLNYMLKKKSNQSKQISLLA
tara:strand:+ start:26 stop:316 length:291 start_codon:yes stop_codon:yes gene_type:complete